MAKSTAAERYWAGRLRSAAFRRRLRALVRAELRHLGTLRLEEVVDRAAIHRIVRGLDLGGLDAAAILEVLAASRERLTASAREKGRPVRDLLGSELAGDVEHAFSAGGPIAPIIEQLAATLLQQELVRRLMTEVIFTAIDAFYRRVNPLFGAVTTRMLEEQIKGFIRLFMPALQRQAIAFATSHANQRLLLEVAGAIVHQILDEPLGRYAGAIAADRRHVEAALRRLLRGHEAEAAVRNVVTAAVDALYAHLGPERLAHLVDLNPHSATGGRTFPRWRAVPGGRRRHRLDASPPPVRSPAGAYLAGCRSLFPGRWSVLRVACSVARVAVIRIRCSLSLSLFAVPCSLFPVRCSLFPVPCSLFPVRCSLLPVRCPALPPAHRHAIRASCRRASTSPSSTSTARWSTAATSWSGW
jgi:hypothetical protein